MTNKNIIRIAASIAAFGICFLIAIDGDKSSSFEEAEGHAWEAFEYWYNQRAFPYDIIPQNAYINAFRHVQRTMLKDRNLRSESVDTSQWVSIGPNNVGGRILAIAVNPINPRVLWIGSASGGLWKSTTAGKGAIAWTFVSTGYPTLAVSSIALSPSNPNIMFIGTGEVGGYYRAGQIGTPGASSTYGMGVLKSTDGGVTWSVTGLVWTFPQITAVQKVLLNPQNPNTIYAATTEGAFKSVDAGATWTKAHDALMAMDIVINPADTSILYATYGQSNSTVNPGLYKTTNAGVTWTLLSGGLPTSNYGRASLAISPINPQVLYAGIANARSSQLLGLYRTTDGGSHWARISTTPNYVGGQGWYDNVVAIHPADVSIVFCSGLDIYKTFSQGSEWEQKSHWNNGYNHVISPGGAEGPPDYAHADHHAITFDPTNPQTMYFGTDGGIFVSTDGGETFEGRNGGLITTQFYGGLANADSDSLIALGGLQDNGTLKYEGYNFWSKVYGGDGGWCAIDPINSDFLYQEYVYLSLSKSTDGGYSWHAITQGLSTGYSDANFIAPFVISPSSPNILYAGARTVFKSTDGGEYWLATNDGSDLNGVPVACIGVSYQSSDTLIAGTGSGGHSLCEIFSSCDGGATWTNVTDTLPHRYPTDISFDPGSSSVAYITYSGYGTSHVFKTTNVGQSWINISSNLPDIPTQSVVVDPFYANHIYVGTDLGVFRTLDGGASWHEYNTGMPPAMVLDLGISKKNRVLRAATHGSGVYERVLPALPALSLAVSAQWNIVSLPAITQNPTVTTIFPSATSSAYAFESHYVIKDTLERGKGYWLKFGFNQTVNVFGTRRLVDTINVKAGWNIIGSVAGSVPASSVVSIPSDNVKSSFYKYNHGYYITTTIEPGKGYWVKVSQNGVLILRAPGSSAKTEASGNSSEISDRLNSLNIEDAAGNKQVLYFGKKPDETFVQHSLELPPVSPSGVFDVRFASDRMIEFVDEAGEHEYPIRFSSVTYPLTITWELKSPSPSGSLAIGDKEYKLGASGSVIIQQPEANVALKVKEESSIPKVFALEQNYPNPFNPRTIIAYSLPANSNVTLKVYDIMGREITTLVDGRVEAGNHEIEFDADNVTSGIYFYKLTATTDSPNKRTFSEVKKMLLLR
jgi:photosystem II stability/assembly factor-like uncharacterized protein